MQKIWFERSIFFTKEKYCKQVALVALNATKVCRLFPVLLLLIFAQLTQAQSVRTTDANAQENIVDRPLVTVNVTVPAMYANVNDIITVPINVTDTTGLGIYGYRFQISFNSAIIQPSGANFGCSEPGTQSAGTTATCNLFPDSHTITVFWYRTTPLAGTLPLINLKFLVVGSIGNVSPLQFVDFFFNEGGPADPVDFTTNGSLTILSPTAANVSVSGRVIGPTGMPVSNAQILMAGDLGFTRRAISNPFGYYRFDDIPAGSAYVLTASSKRFSFQARIISLIDDLTGFDIIADP